MKTKKTKKISRQNLVQLGIIVGQLSHLQAVNLQGNQMYLLDGKICQNWMTELKRIIEEEIK